MEARLADPDIYADGVQAPLLLKRFGELREATEKLIEYMAPLETRMAALEAKRASLGEL